MKKLLSEDRKNIIELKLFYYFFYKLMNKGPKRLNEINCKKLLNIRLGAKHFLMVVYMQRLPKKINAL